MRDDLTSLATIGILLVQAGFVIFVGLVMEALARRGHWQRALVLAGLVVAMGVVSLFWSLLVGSDESWGLAAIAIICAEFALGGVMGLWLGNLQHQRGKR